MLKLGIVGVAFVLASFALATGCASHSNTSGVRTTQPSRPVSSEMVVTTPPRAPAPIYRAEPPRPSGMVGYAAPAPRPIAPPPRPVPAQPAPVQPDADCPCMHENQGP